MLVAEVDPSYHRPYVCLLASSQRSGSVLGQLAANPLYPMHIICLGSNGLLTYNLATLVSLVIVQIVSSKMGN